MLNSKVLIKDKKRFNCILFTFALFFISFSTFAQEVVTVTNSDDLADELATATPGKTIIVQNGSYNDFEVTVEVAGTADSPITIKAETVGGVTLTGNSKINFKKTEHCVVEGFVFDCDGDETLVKLEGCNNIRITRNVFETAQTESVKWVYIGGVWDDTVEPYQYLSHNNRIDHNVFKNKTMPGHYITIDGTNGLIQSQYDRIDHNHFINNGPRATNEQESIRIGWSEMSMSSGFTTVEYNLFENCDGDPEIVSVKSCDNIIRHNTFKGCYGTLSLRHGNRNWVEGNYFFGNGREIGEVINEDLSVTNLYTGGIRVYGTDHVIINNYMEGLNGTKWDAPITITQGDVIDGQSTSYSSHFRAERVLVAYNTLVNNSHGIEIGFDNNGKYGKELKDITIANNLISGSENSLVEIKDGNDQGSNITWINNLFYTQGDATLISGNTTTTFDDNMVKNEDPKLIFDESGSGLWRTTAESPVYASDVVDTSIDMDGDERPESGSNPGADHFSLETVRYAPMTESTVGPYAYELDEETENLYVLASISDFAAIGSSAQIVDITSNVEWTVSCDAQWVNIIPASGTGNGSFEITVSDNITFESRSATIVVEGGDLTRNFTINQEGSDPHEGLYLINHGYSNDMVTAIYAFDEEVTSTKNNIKEHTLDKDFDTQWAGNGIGDEGGLVFDLGDAYELKLIDVATTSGKSYEFQIWVSTTGTQVEDFFNAFPDQGNLESTSEATMQSYYLEEAIADVRYVKIIGYGQPAKDNSWNTIQEIEFFTTNEVYIEPNPTSLDEDGVESDFKIYPNPAKDFIIINNLKSTNELIQLYSIDGQLVIERKVDSSEMVLDLSDLNNGIYLMYVVDRANLTRAEKIVVSH